MHTACRMPGIHNLPIRGCGESPKGGAAARLSQPNDRDGNQGDALDNQFSKETTLSQINQQICVFIKDFALLIYLLS